jgi:NADPH:quinone reductase-like Zn-dependent oxidoreductase
MQAVALWRFGGPGVLELVALPPPIALPGQVVIRVAGATVNPTDALFRSGALASGLDPAARPPFVPGREVSGVVEAAPAGSRWRPGDQVATLPSPLPAGRGGYAELIAISEDSLIRVPAGWSLLEAATLAMNGLTVRAALDELALEPGARLVVTGAAGAVGGYSVQMAAAEGIEVTAVSAPADEALCRRLGAGEFVPRSPGFARVIRERRGGADALLDAALVGRSAFDAIRNGGAYAAVRAFAEPPERGIRIVSVSVARHAADRRKLERVADLAAKRVLTPRIAAALPPGQAAEAHRRLERGGLRGRLVLTFESAI